MGLTKINQILKKYKKLHAEHVQSWEDINQRIVKKPHSYMHESYEYQLKGNKLLSALMKELEGHEIFPKKSKTF